MMVYVWFADGRIARWPLNWATLEFPATVHLADFAAEIKKQILEYIQLIVSVWHEQEE